MRLIFTLALAVWMAGPAFAQEQAQSDPLEPVNRGSYAMTDAADRMVLAPLARGYRAVTPGFFRAGVRNFLRNLGNPVTFVNDVLQGEPTRAARTAARFGINSTVGVLGLADVAERMGIEHHSEDFGQTLAVWGVGPGPYLFVPLRGPTTLRDTVGSVVDLAFDPLSWADFQNVDEVRVGRAALSVLSAREENLENVEGMQEASIDPYVSVRSGYSLLRESAVRNGPQDVQDLPEFEATDEPATGESEPPAAEPPPEATGAAPANGVAATP